MTEIDQINKFCESKNTIHLSKLNQKYSVLLRYSASYALTVKNAKHDLANKILEYYRSDEKGRVFGSGKYTIKDAEERFSKMSVSLTGARAGDIIVGASKGTNGAVIRLYGKDVPPEKTRLDSIRAYPELWDRFLVKLGSVPFFAKMTSLSREVWLAMHEASNENSIGGEGTRLELVQPGTSNFAEVLEEEDLDLLIQGNPDSEDGYWSYTEIENMFPRKPGSKAVRHTLILIRSFWKIAVDYEVASSFEGVSLNVQSGDVITDAKANEIQEMFIVPGITKEIEKLKGKWVRPTGSDGIQKVGLLVSKDRLLTDNIPALITDIVPCEFERIKDSYRNFTGASYKSLLQKIIRFRPKTVEMPDGFRVPADHALAVCIGMLAMHPGAFVPDIQRYVTGIESCAKRLGVTIVEDSYTTNNHDLLSLMSGSLLSQRVRSWKPDETVMRQWTVAGIKGWESLTAAIVDFQGEVTKKPYVLTAGQTPLEAASAILDELRSFPTDLGLARAWARDYPNIKTSKAVSTPDIMRLEHCVDHHWAPGVIHYFRPEFVYTTGKGKNIGQPFEKLFGVIWDKASSINPRKNKIDFSKYERIPEILEIRHAQKLYLTALQTKQKTRAQTGDTYEVEYILPESWIAAMVGPIEIKISGFPVMIVTMAGDDPMRLLVIRSPSRNMSVEPLTPEQEEVAIKSAKRRLKDGIKLDKTQLPDPSLQGHHVYLMEDSEGEPFYAVGKPKEEEVRYWDDARELSVSVPILEKMDDWSVEKALVYTSYGIEEGADESLELLLEETSNPIILRALTYISTFDRTIEMNRISRDGGGTYHAVTLEDVPAYQFLLRLSSLFPAGLAPCEHGPSRFVVKVGPVLWNLRKKISTKMAGRSVEGADGWEKVRFSDDSRELWEHQTSMVADMVKNNEAGNKGNFIWVTVGLGKTAGILTFLQHLKSVRKLPKYIIYTLPESAIKSIIDEIKCFGVPINLIIPLKDIRKKAGNYATSGITITQNCEPVPYVINMIEHDHLKKCEETLMEFAPRSFIVVDEVHKTLNDSKRSSVAQGAAQLSEDFVVLTGTPVIDSNTHKLLPWLKQVVPYEVNSKNFFVAANSMIAKKVKTGVKVNDEEPVAIMTTSEEKAYRELVPPVLGGTNPNPRSDDWRVATEICYSSASRDMAKETLRSVRVDNRGVMLVAKDKKHQEVLRLLLIALGMKNSDIYVLQGGDSISLTDDTVKEGKIHDYRVVIVPISMSAGYNLTRLSVMITSVYPSNNATRTQLRGRIDRISQNSKQVWYRTFHVGILTSIMRNHNAAKNLNTALEGLAEMV
jgi:superfamily II DNA or RNA helicase